MTGQTRESEVSAERMRPSEKDLRETAVPKLLHVLRYEKNPDLVTGTIVALAKIGLDSRISSELASLLSNPNQEIAETAVLGLGLLRDARALPTLLSLAKDEAQGRSFVGKAAVPLRTRVFAVYALGLFGARASEEAVKIRIVDALRDASSAQGDFQVARVLALGLVKDAQRRGAEDLRRLLEDRDADTRVRAMVPISLARLLVEVSKDDGAAKGHPLISPVRERILSLAEDRSQPEWIRSSCIQSLPHFVAGNPAFAQSARESLSRAIRESRTQSEKHFAAIALGRLGGEASRVELERLLGKSGTLRPWAALGLGILGRQDDSMASTIAAKVRQTFESERNPSTSAALAISLGLLRDEASAGLLAARMRAGSNEELKGFLALGLGLIGSREALPEIATVAREAVRRPELQQQAVIGLGLLGDPSVGVDLVRWLGEARTLSVQSSLASAIGWIGDRRSLEPLLPLLEGTKLVPVSRAFVAAAIGMIGDPDEIHWSAQLSGDFNYYAAPHTLVDRASFAGLLDIL